MIKLVTQVLLVLITVLCPIFVQADWRVNGTLRLVYLETQRDPPLTPTEVTQVSQEFLRVVPSAMPLRLSVRRKGKNAILTDRRTGYRWRAKTWNGMLRWDLNYTGLLPGYPETTCDITEIGLLGGMPGGSATSRIDLRYVCANLPLNQTGYLYLGFFGKVKIK